mmetsp:Transcript_5381/g.10301  ORF Transcript_5381/g.10301 Transcript_5381/m.10301 type:complete len:278 (-) Transcript_5381:215-1048(-)
MQLALALAIAVGAAPLSARAAAKGAASPPLRSVARRHPVASRIAAAHRRPLAGVRAGKHYEGAKIAELFSGNQEWSEDMNANNRPLMDFLGTTQVPKIMWIGSSDSRVPESMITGMDPGEIFTVRNFGNQAQTTDNSVNSAIQFGVLGLGVEDILVCGHYDCGATAAVLSNQDLSAPLDQWVGPIREVYRTHKGYLDELAEPDRLIALTKLNAVEQALNVFTAAPVQQRRAATAGQEGGPIPRVHAVVYDPATGLLNDMNIDFERLAAMNYGGSSFA